MAPESIVEVRDVDNRPDLVRLRANLQLMMSSRHREVVSQNDVFLAFEAGENRTTEQRAGVLDVGEGSNWRFRELGAAAGARFVANDGRFVRSVERACLVEAAVADRRRVAPHQIPNRTAEGVSIFLAVE